jgi:hypothetical protein
MSASQARVAVLAVLAGVAFRPAPGRSADAPKPDVESAIAFVEAYVSLYRDVDSTEKLAAKIVACWDWEAVAEGAFGADLPAAGTPERAALRNKVERLLAAGLADEATHAAFKRAKVQQPGGTMVGPDRAVVSYLIVHPDKNIVNNLAVLRWSGGRWKMVDVADGRKDAREGCVGQLKAEYQRVRGKQTPGQFLDDVLAVAEPGRR